MAEAVREAQGDTVTLQENRGWIGVVFSVVLIGNGSWKQRIFSV